MDCDRNRSSAGNSGVYTEEENHGYPSDSPTGVKDPNDRMMFAERLKWRVWPRPSEARPEQDRKSIICSRDFVSLTSLRRKPHTKNLIGNQTSGHEL